MRGRDSASGWDASFWRGQNPGDGCGFSRNQAEEEEGSAVRASSSLFPVANCTDGEAVALRETAWDYPEFCALTW
ncbi:hypothetical protein GCM10010961_42140 [Pseudodonghicola xiamenensis]|uniref:Uncharacterized protein n=1 Tax=Pseudodonghicola xiamenensis TaxID=337702 RepID=A0A8J3HCI5_9RHOB|nr:hypothetical protein GCM10010961_42140 [Pseudodonghicola xiamenensis]